MFPNPLDIIPWITAQEDAVLRTGFDANDWIAQTWAYDRHNVGDTPGFGGYDLRALASVKAKSLIITAGQLDLYNPVEEAEEAALYLPASRLAPIPSVQGHVAASPAKAADVEFMNRVTREFLTRSRMAVENSSEIVNAGKLSRRAMTVDTPISSQAWRSLSGTSVLATPGRAEQISNGGAEVPARKLPVPETVSPQVQKLIAAPLRPGWNVLPKTGEEWKPVAEAGAQAPSGIFLG